MTGNVFTWKVPR